LVNGVFEEQKSGVNGNHPSSTSQGGCTVRVDIASQAHKIRDIMSGILLPISLIITLIFDHSTFAFHVAAPARTVRITGTRLPMGLLDSLGSFLNNREDDFVKLGEESSDNIPFGPGPAILIYGCPSDLTDMELNDMISDGAPKASKKTSSSNNKGVICRRIDASTTEILDLSVQQALEKVVKEGSSAIATDAAAPPTSIAPCPVIYFSGISNEEMMATYRIISSEIYEETGGAAKAACAKAVPPAMEKPLRQVIEEITGDHLAAIG
jgi:hypothetical protein